MRLRNLNFDGTGQTVVVIDSGYDIIHRNDNIIYEFDFNGNDQDAFNGQQDSHGGAVATVVNQFSPGHIFAMLPEILQEKDEFYQYAI